MPAVTAMKGEGFYDRHSTVQQMALDVVGSWLESAVAALPLPEPPAAITVADYGCAEGRNSVRAVGAVIEALGRRTMQPVCGVHCDLPGNNFNQLFATLHDPATATYLHQDGRRRPHVHALATAGSFYEVLLPHQSVHVALSFFSLQWLDRAPAVRLPESVSYLRADPEIAARFRAQAEHDLARFLVSRAVELVPGGVLIILVPGAIGGRCCGDGPYDVFDDAVRDLLAAGRVTPAAAERFVFPAYFYSLDDFIRPIDQPGSALQAVFTIEDTTARAMPTPFEDKLAATGDAATYAAEYTAFVRAFSEPLVRATLVGPDGDPGLVDELYARVRQRLAADPCRYTYHNLQVAMWLTRK